MFPECRTCPRCQHLGPPPWPNPRRSVGVEVVQSCSFSGQGSPELSLRLPGRSCPLVSIGRPGWMGTQVGTLKHPRNLKPVILVPVPTSAASAPTPGVVKVVMAKASTENNRKGMRGPQPSGSPNASLRRGVKEKHTRAQGSPYGRLHPPLSSSQAARASQTRYLSGLVVGQAQVRMEPGPES